MAKTYGILNGLPVERQLHRNTSKDIGFTYNDYMQASYYFCKPKISLEYFLKNGLGAEYMFRGTKVRVTSVDCEEWNTGLINTTLTIEYFDSVSCEHISSKVNYNVFINTCEKYVPEYKSSPLKFHESHIERIIEKIQDCLGGLVPIGISGEILGNTLTDGIPLIVVIHTARVIYTFVRKEARKRLLELQLEDFGALYIVKTKRSAMIPWTDNIVSNLSQDITLYQLLPTCRMSDEEIVESILSRFYKDHLRVSKVQRKINRIIEEGE